jgi:hypothetical protein
MTVGVDDLRVLDALPLRAAVELDRPLADRGNGYADPACLPGSARTAWPGGAGGMRVATCGRQATGAVMGDRKK